MPHALRVLALCLITLAVTSCSKPRPSSPSAPASSDLRIVSLSPAAADIVRDLGLAAALVGRNSADVWTDRAVPSCGELGRIDYEALIAARPTHVLIQEAVTPPRLVQLSIDHHWRIDNLSLLTLDEIRASTRLIVDALPDSHRAATSRELARIEQQMDRAWPAPPGDDLAHSPPPLKVLLLASIDPPAALGPGSFHVQILQRLGAANVPPTGSPYITLAAEDIVALAPDAIIVILPRDPDASTMSSGGAPTADENSARALASLGVLGRLDIPAVRNRRLALIDDPKAHLPSTAMIRVADQIHAILARWK